MTSIKTMESSKFPKMRRNLSRITCRKEVNAVPPYTIKVTAKSVDRWCVTYDAVSMMESKRYIGALTYYWEFLPSPGSVYQFRMDWSVLRGRFVDISMGSIEGGALI